jgi:hypothetical protein
VTEQTNDFIDGNLGFWSAMKVRFHLLGCKYCPRFVDQMRTVVGLVRPYEDTLSSGETEQELLAALRTQASNPQKMKSMIQIRVSPNPRSIVMNNIGKGVIAGFVATSIVSILFLMKAAMGLMPDLNIIVMLSGMMGGALIMGWVAHFVIGAVIWGVLFALLHPSVPGGSLWLKGVVFGVAAWLMMMIVVMPMLGGGIFGINFGMVAPAMTLMVHVIFGAVLGGVYATLQNREPTHQHAHS